MVAERPDRLLNEKEAAAYLSVKPISLATWRCNKRYPIPYIKLGRAVRYRLSSLDAFLATITEQA